MLTDLDINRIADAVAARLNIAKTTLTIAEAAEYMGITAKSKSLSAIFSRFSNPRLHKVPLKYSRVGKCRIYRAEDLDRFIESKGRGF